MGSTGLKFFSHVYRTSSARLKMLFSSKYLLYTNTAISVGMSCSADYIQQHMQIHKKEVHRLNIRRSRDVAVTGFLIGPFCHYWYIMLDKWLPGKSMRIVTKKIIVDQIICSPVVIGLFLVTTSYLEGKKGKAFTSELYEKGITLYKADWLIWPPAQAFNFLVLPTKYRVLFDNTVSFMFDWYYSYVKYGVSEDNVDHSNMTDEMDEGNDYDDSLADLAATGSHVPSLNMEDLNHLVCTGRIKGKKKLMHMLYTEKSSSVDCNGDTK